MLSVPADDDGSFARLVGAYAAGLDAGIEPARLSAPPSRPVGGRPLEPSDLSAPSRGSWTSDGSRRSISSGPLLRTLLTSGGTG